MGKWTAITAILGIAGFAIQVIRGALDLWTDFDWILLILFIILAIGGIASFIDQYLKGKDENKRKLPDLQFSIDSEKFMEEFPTSNHFLFIENINPNVGAEECTIKYSHNGDKFEDLTPNILTNWLREKVFEIPPMKNVKIDCYSWFYREGNYELNMRFKPNITTDNKDWKGLNYWWVIKIKLKSSPLDKDDRAKLRWKIADISKPEKDGKIDGRA
ncbi:MAG: hypothetical protein KAJ64_04285 [Thermoplasmata archaeon]|nr:hypothetical protein [Thermoplasmata archaeon]